MNNSTRFVLMTLLGASVSGFAFAQTVIPLNGQSPEQIQMDVAQCQAAGKTASDQALASASATAPPPASTSAAPPPSGGRMRGAATAATASAVRTEVRGNQYEHYDDIDSDVKQDYRQEQAKDAAVAGAVVGGSRQRRARRESEQQQSQEQAAAQQQQAASSTEAAENASRQAYSTCMSGRGYSINP